jgi:hypothetical protein
MEATNSWDSPLRTRRLDENGKPISEADWRAGVWFNVTSITDPPDVHVYVLMRWLDKREREE